MAWELEMIYGRCGTFYLVCLFLFVCLFVLIPKGKMTIGVHRYIPDCCRAFNWYLTTIITPKRTTILAYYDSYNTHGINAHAHGINAHGIL